MGKTTTFAGAALMLLCSGGAASAKGLTIAQLTSLAADLGYEVTVKGNVVTIPDQGKSGYDVGLSLSDDGSTVLTFVNMPAIPPEKRAAIPYRDLLLATTARFAFALNTDDKDEWLDLQGSLDATTLNKQALRKALDALVTRVDGTETVWNQANWKIAAAPAPAAVAAPAACLGDKGPLGAKNVTLVTRKAAAVGDIQARPTATFKPGEPFVVYLEPAGFQCKVGPNGHTLADIDSSLELVQGDKVMFKKADYLKGAIDSPDPLTSVFFNLSATIDGLPAGAYALKFGLHDVYGGRDADVSVPLTIAP